MCFLGLQPKITNVSRNAAGRSGDVLTTGQAAELLGTSRQHVVDLCMSGRLPYMLTGSHRRVRRADVEALRAGSAALTRDQQRSLWLHRAVAGKLVMNPGPVVARARRNLARLRAAHPRGLVREDFDAWEALLDGPPGRLSDVLVSASPQAVRLRQNTPFAGVLTEGERAMALKAFRDSVQAA